MLGIASASQGVSPSAPPSSASHCLAPACSATPCVASPRFAWHRLARHRPGLGVALPGIGRLTLLGIAQAFATFIARHRLAQHCLAWYGLGFNWRRLAPHRLARQASLGVAPALLGTPLHSAPARLAAPRLPKALPCLEPPWLEMARSASPCLAPTQFGAAPPRSASARSAAACWVKAWLGAGSARSASACSSLACLASPWLRAASANLASVPLALRQRRRGLVSPVSMALLVSALASGGPPRLRATTASLALARLALPRSASLQPSVALHRFARPARHRLVSRLRSKVERCACDITNFGLDPSGCFRHCQPLGPTTNPVRMCNVTLSHCSRPNLE